MSQLKTILTAVSVEENECNFAFAFDKEEFCDRVIVLIDPDDLAHVTGKSQASSKMSNTSRNWSIASAPTEVAAPAVGKVQEEKHEIMSLDDKDEECDVHEEPHTLDSDEMDPEEPVAAHCAGRDRAPRDHSSGTSGSFVGLKELMPTDRLLGLEDIGPPKSLMSLELEDMDPDADIPARREIKVSGLILAKGSKFFRTMFTSEFSESKSKEITLQVKRRDWDIYHGVIKFLYNPKDEFLPSLGFKDAMRFLMLSDQIQAPSAMAAAIGRLAEIPLDSIICDTLLILPKGIQDLPCFKTLCWRVEQYLIETYKNVEESWDCKEFLQLSPPCFDLLLKSSQLVVRSENSVWAMVERWLEYGKQYCKHHNRRMQDLFTHIRYGSMTPQYLLNVVKNSEHFKEIPDLAERTHAALGYLALQDDPEQQEWLVGDSVSYAPRQTPTSRLRIFAWDIPADKIRSMERNQSHDSGRFLSNGYFFDLFIKREESLGLYLEFLPEATKIMERFRLPKATWSVWARSQFVNGSYKCLKATSKNFTSDMRPGLGFGHANVFSKDWDQVVSEAFDYCVDNKFSFKIKLEWV